MKRKIVLFLLMVFVLVLALPLMGFRFLADTPPPVDWTQLVSTLTYLATGPGSMALALLVGAWLQNIWPFWANWDAAIKNFILLILAAVFAVGATLLLQQTQLLELIQPYYQLIANVVLAWIGGALFWSGKKRQAVLAARAAMTPHFQKPK